MAQLLVIEDDNERAETLKFIMEFAMHEINVVVDGNAAIQYLKSADPLPEGIIANVIQHGLDGLQLCRIIRATRAWQLIPVLLIGSPTNDTRDENLASRAGAAAFIRRPFHRDDLLNEIDRTLLMGGLHNDMPMTYSANEEIAFLRDYNRWLADQLYHAASQLETTSENLQIHDAHVAAIHQMTTALGYNLDFQSTVKTIVRKAAEILRAQVAGLYFFNENTDVFDLLHVEGFGMPTPEMPPEYELDEQSPFWRIMGRDKPLLFDASDTIQQVIQAFSIEYPPTSLVATPLVSRGELRGFMFVGRSDEDDPLTEEDAEIVMSISGAAGLALRSAQLFTQMESTYEELQELDRRKSEFVAITSHELRTPIAVMLGYTSLLHDMEEDPNKKLQLATIQKQANFLAGMVDALLNIHQLSDGLGQAPTKLLPVRIDKLLQDALEITLEQGNHHKEVAFHIDSDPVEINADEVRLMLALTNLMDNAIKFSDPNDTVTILATAHPEGGVVITIQDEGIGIKEEHYEQIFEPFFQVEPAMTRHHGGLGLGLAIVKGMIDLHGGTIEIKSKFREGTRFVITLPSRQPSY